MGAAPNAVVAGAVAPKAPKPPVVAAGFAPKPVVGVAAAPPPKIPPAAFGWPAAGAADPETLPRDPGNLELIFDSHFQFLFDSIPIHQFVST